MKPDKMNETYYSDSFHFRGISTSCAKEEYNPNILNNSINSSHIKKEEIIQRKCFRDVYDKLLQITKKYNLGSLTVEEDYEEVYAHIFVIQVPKEYSNYKKVLEIWDKIIDEIHEYCNNMNYIQYYKVIQILLR